ncbi:MAG: FHA domain-containing protein [Betaproteobacteria bacterium]|nr:FHA domain-containing protein [Betaproteobacteria bacterium]
MDIPLTKERITIGRRADNDVCLPYPAVSGEHAAVTTILADSFLEDLGSTNGTLVNGRAIAKHFLVDYDQIDIGRQRLTYLSDNEAKADPLPPDLARAQMRGLADKVEPAKPLPHVDVPPAGDRRPQFGARGTPLVTADIEREIAPPEAAPTAAPRPDPGATATAAAPATPVPAERAAEGRGPTGRAAEARAEGAAPPAAPPPAAPAPPGPSVRVLSGASLGRIVPFPDRELTIGRVGVQVAAVRKVEGGYRLIPLEGREPPRINGAPVAPDGSPLHPGDTFEVAGVRLELSLPA